MPVDPDRLVAAVSAAMETVTAPLLARIAVLEQRTVLHGRDGKDGADGHDGAAGGVGLPGPAGRDGTNGQDGLPGLQGPAGERGLLGEKGMDGLAGRDGRDGLPGLHGEKGLDGKDGTHGLHGKDGADGRDGLGFEDLDFDEDARGRSYAKFVRGDLVKTARITSVTDQGVWRDGTSYLKWDGATWGGSFWIAQKDTTAKPGDGSSEWRLAVKKGVDGREGKSGQDGKDGRPGRDLTVAGKPW